MTNTFKLINSINTSFDLLKIFIDISYNYCYDDETIINCADQLNIILSYKKEIMNEDDLSHNIELLEETVYLCAQIKIFSNDPIIHDAYTSFRYQYQTEILDEIRDKTFFYSFTEQPVKKRRLNDGSCLDLDTFTLELEERERERDCKIVGY